MNPRNTSGPIFHQMPDGMWYWSLSDPLRTDPMPTWGPFKIQALAEKHHHMKIKNARERMLARIEAAEEEP